MEMMLLRRKLIISDKPLVEDEAKDTVTFISVRISNLSACSGFLDIGIYIQRHMKTVTALRRQHKEELKGQTAPEECFIKTDQNP